MKMRFFDFEVTPNWWLCVFGDMPDEQKDIKESIKETFTIVDSDMENARDLLMEQLREENFVMTGYNIKAYDLVIANAIYNAFTPQEVKIVNDLTFKKISEISKDYKILNDCEEVKEPKVKKKS